MPKRIPPPKSLASPPVVVKPPKYNHINGSHSIYSHGVPQTKGGRRRKTRRHRRHRHRTRKH